MHKFKPKIFFLKFFFLLPISQLISLMEKFEQLPLYLNHKGDNWNDLNETCLKVAKINWCWHEFTHTVNIKQIESVANLGKELRQIHSLPTNCTLDQYSRENNTFKWIFAYSFFGGFARIWLA